MVLHRPVDPARTIRNGAMPRAMGSDGMAYKGSCIDANTQNLSSLQGRLFMFR